MSERSATAETQWKLATGWEAAYARIAYGIAAGVAGQLVSVSNAA
jgi:hypothetical protein